MYTGAHARMLTVIQNTKLDSLQLCLQYPSFTPWQLGSFIYLLNSCMPLYVEPKCPPLTLLVCDPCVHMPQLNPGLLPSNVALYSNGCLSVASLSVVSILGLFVWPSSGSGHSWHQTPGQLHQHTGDRTEVNEDNCSLQSERKGPKV